MTSELRDLKDQGWDFVVTLGSGFRGERMPIQRETKSDL